MIYIDTSDNNPTFSTSNDVAEISKPLKKLGINFFTYTRVERCGGRIYLTSSPAILEKYFKEQYYLTGNTEGCPSHYKSQVVLWDALPNQTVFDECARVQNYDHGMYIIESGDDYCDFFGFATRKGNSGIINTYLSKLDYLKSFTSYFKDEAKQIIRTVAEKKVILPFSRHVINFTELDNTTDESITIQHHTHQVKFTPRQLSVAQKFVDGLGIKSIAKELKLSPRTIEQHINALKTKLHCNKSTELVLKLAHLIQK
jgi:LuxR family quorum-sensing system transcriptional regulator SolR